MRWESCKAARRASGLLSVSYLVLILAGAFAAICTHATAQETALQESTLQKTGIGQRPFAEKLDKLFGSGHLRDTIQCVTFSPDGKYAVTGGEAIRFWDVRTGELHHELKGKVSRFYALTYSPDGTLLAGGGFSGGFTVWDVEHGKEVFAVEKEGGSEETICSIAFSPDGARIATGATGSKAFVWSSTTGEQLVELDITARQYLNSVVAWSPDGKQIAAADSQGYIHLFDADTYDKLHAIPAYASVSSGITGLVYLDNKFLASAGTVRMRNDQGGTEFHGSVRIWNTERGALKRLLPNPGQMRSVRALSLMPDGQHLLIHSSSDLQVVRIDDGATVERVGEFSNFSPNPQGMAVSADGKFLARAEGGASTLQLFDRQSGGRVLPQNAGHDGQVISTAVSPDGTLLATFGHDRQMQLWDTETAEVVAAYHCENQAYPRVGVWSPDGRYLYFGCQRLNREQNGGVLYCYDVRDKTIAFELDMPSTVMGCAVSSDGQTLAVSGGFGRSGGETTDDGLFLRVLDARSGRILHEFNGTGSYAQMRFTDDGRLLVCAPFINGRSIDFWDLTSGELAREEPLAIRRFGLLARNEPRLAAITGNERIEIFDTQTMEQIRVLQEPGRWYDRLAISADGRLLATTSRATEVADGRELPTNGDADLCVWNIETRELVYKLPELDLTYWNFEFSPDGKWLYGSSSSGVAAGWDLSSID